MGWGDGHSLHRHRHGADRRDILHNGALYGIAGRMRTVGEDHEGEAPHVVAYVRLLVDVDIRMEQNEVTHCVAPFDVCVVPPTGGGMDASGVPRTVVWSAFDSFDLSRSAPNLFVRPPGDTDERRSVRALDHLTDPLSTDGPYDRG